MTMLPELSFLVGKLLLYKRNKTLWDMLLLNNNQLQGDTLYQATTHHIIVDYFPITAQPQVYYYLLNFIYDKHICNEKLQYITGADQLKHGCEKLIMCPF